MVQGNVPSVAHVHKWIYLWCGSASWEYNDCIYSQKKKEIIYGHKPLRTVVYKELKNKKEIITVNEVTSINTMLPELLNK